MPFVNNLDVLNSKANGGSNNQMNSLEDEESFVVLERVTANDDTFPLDVTIQSLQSFNSLSNNAYTPLINETPNIPNSDLHHSQFEAVPIQQLAAQYESNNISLTIEDIQKQLKEVLCENINLKENLFQTNLAMKQHMNTVRLLQDRASDVQKNHQAKFEDTKALILQLGSEKKELQEAKVFLSEELIKAKQEIKDVKESNVAFGNEMAKVLSENDSLKKQISHIEENSKKHSLQPSAKELELHELTDHLSRKLEAVERYRRQQEFDIDRLQAQLGRTIQELNEAHRKLALAENGLKVVKDQPPPQVNSGNSSINYGDRFDKYNTLLDQIKTSVLKEQTRCNSLSSWLAIDPVQFEVSELRRLLAEEQLQSVARKEGLSQAVSTINDLLIDFKNVSEELDLLKADLAVKETNRVAYNEVQQKAYNERLDVLTAKLLKKEEEFAICERHLASLQEAIRLMNAENKDTCEIISLQEELREVTNNLAAKEETLQANNQEINLLKSEIERLRTVAETVTVFEAQAKIYQDDFETERKARESLVAEKERLIKDIKLLQMRNQELINEFNKINTGENLPTSPLGIVNNRSDQPPPEPQRLQGERLSPPNRFYCPNPECNKEFNTEVTNYNSVQEHVIACLKLTD